MRYYNNQLTVEKRVSCNLSRMSAQEALDNSSEMSESLESVVETNLSTMSSDNFSWSISKPECPPKEPKSFAVICEEESENNESHQLSIPTSR